MQIFINHAQLLGISLLIKFWK